MQESKESMKSKLISDFVIFLIAGLLWIATISSNTFGFVPLRGGESVGYDSWTLFMYICFFLASRRLYRTIKASRNAATTNGQEKSAAPGK